jgi:hypothetical protein
LDGLPEVSGIAPLKTDFSLCQNPGHIGAALALQLPDFHNPALLCQKLIFLA